MGIGDRLQLVEVMLEHLQLQPTVVRSNIRPAPSGLFFTRSYSRIK